MERDCINCIYETRGRERRGVLVKSVKKLGLHKEAENLLTS
jgi:hypothetical protein